MLAGRSIGPFAGGPLRRVLKTHEHRAARRIVDVADQPVAALAPAVGEIVTAHRLGLAREAVRQFGSIAGHSRGLPFSDALDSVVVEHPRQDLDAVEHLMGTNMRSFQEMISAKRP